MAASQEVLQPERKEYPKRLRVLSRPPAKLYVTGTIPTGPAVAIVGARGADYRGLGLTRSIAAELARAGVAVVSGGARGIDQAAHMGALDAGGPTVMVLGCGLGVEYPRGSSRLRESVSEAGAVISELPPDTPPRPAHFHRRNQILIALVDAVLVVQAGARSGALAMAELARKMGRKVLAVPGLPGVALTRGTHGLLRTGALMAENGRDVLEAIGVDFVHVEAEKTAPPRKRGLAGKVLRWLDQGPSTADEIARGIERPVSEILAVLVELELEGLLICIGGCYEKA